MNIQVHPSFRPQFIIGFVITVGLIAVALFMQYGMDMEPCPLCILQRLVVIGLGIVFLIGLVHNPMGWGRRVYGVVLSLLSAIGIGLTIRHIWLQHLPKDQVPECGPGLAFWMDRLPTDQLLMKMLEGSGECAKVSFQFIGLSIPEWMMIIFSLFMLFSLKVLFMNR